MKPEIKSLVIEFIDEELKKRNNFMEELENSLIGLLPTLEERKSEINEQNIHDKIN